MHTSARSALIGGAVMVAIATTFALGRGTVPAHQLRDKPFADMHEDLATLAMMSERVAQLDKPKLVQTEAIKPIERDPLMMALSTEPAPMPKRKAAVVAGDICAKHGLRKIITNGGKSWRCQR